jgi:hypothetical protein
MALPLSIFGDLPFPEEAWQIEEADDLVFAAQRDLTKRRYEACRLKCNAALSYANMLFETKVAAYIELAWSFDEWGSVRVYSHPTRLPALYDFPKQPELTCTLYAGRASKSSIPSRRCLPSLRSHV